MRFTHLAAWLAWQETCHPREIDLGLGRIRRVAQRMDLLQPQARVITVAGTNGKGSCVATLEHMLLAQGKTVGAYSSPHLVHYNERIRIGGVPASDADICTAFAAIDDARGDISLSYFEFGTLAAFWLFRHYAVDYWVLEVGLGGRLDATNLIDADVAVVTSIALDHQQFLGNDRESIGREKAGIFRAHKPVVCADTDAPRSLIDHARALDCPALYAGRDFDWQERPAARDWLVHLWVDGQVRTLELPLPRLPMPSVAAALQVLALLGELPPSDVLAAHCETLQLAGRFQEATWAGKPVLLDVAHNPAAAEYLAERLRSRGAKDLGIVIAMMADKDIGACLAPLQPFVRHWWLARLSDTPRAAAPQILENFLRELGVPTHHITSGASVAEAVAQALADGLQEKQCEALLVTGSFYTVSAAIKACEAAR